MMENEFFIIGCKKFNTYNSCVEALTITPSDSIMGKCLPSPPLLNRKSVTRTCIENIPSVITNHSLLKAPDLSWNNLLATISAGEPLCPVTFQDDDLKQLILPDLDVGLSHSEKTQSMVSFRPIRAPSLRKACRVSSVIIPLPVNSDSGNLSISLCEIQKKSVSSYKAKQFLQGSSLPPQIKTSFNALSAWVTSMFSCFTFCSTILHPLIWTASKSRISNSTKLFT